MTTLVLALGVAFAAQPAQEKEDAESPAWAIIARRHAAACEVVAKRNPDRPLASLKDPVLQRSQEVQGSSTGAVFLWLESSGRPAAICDVFLFAMGAEQYRLSNEWHSLSDVPVRVQSPGSSWLNATVPGLEWTPIPDAPAPAEKSPQRDRQVRRLSERFGAHLIDRKKARFPLRLLPTPLYRYDASDSASSLGGALFAFCQQTDPELLLLIEVRKSGPDERWEYAPAGFSDMALYLHLDEREVWNDAPAFTRGRGVHSGGTVRIVNIAAELEAAKRDEEAPRE